VAVVDIQLWLYDLPIRGDPRPGFERNFLLLVIAATHGVSKNRRARTP
jgi:hypothetical protein